MHSSRQMGVCSLRLQHGVIDDVVVRQRLLDHHEVEIVQLLEMIGVLQRVGRIGVRHQLDGRETARAPGGSRPRPSPGLIFILMRW